MLIIHFPKGSYLTEVELYHNRVSEGVKEYNEVSLYEKVSLFKWQFVSFLFNTNQQTKTAMVKISVVVKSYRYKKLCKISYKTNNVLY